MATKQTTKRAANRSSRSAKTASDSSQAAGTRVRMYRQGLGDCFLITLPRKNAKPYYIMIDCGVILGTP
jgi:hypothetical protein